MSVKNITLSENNPKPLEEGMLQEVDKVIKHFEGELIKIRTGRAHPALGEDIRVVAYG